MSTVDVIPLGDQRRHLVPGGYSDSDDDATEGWLALERNVAGPTTCWCEPRLVPIVDGDEVDAHVIHRAADGREREETQ